MLNNIKLIATDLDGTVLEKGELANPEDLKTLLKIQKLGINLTIATGQDWSNARQTALKFAIDQNLNYMICNNGAYISKVSVYEPIYTYAITQEIVQKIYDQCLEMKLCWIAYYHELEHVYWNGIKLTCESLLQRNWPEKYFWKDISQQKNFVFDQVFQMMVFVPQDQKLVFEKWFKKEQLASSVLAMESNLESMPIYEFINIAANKGNALLNLIKHLKLNLNQVVSFGDNLNDLEMMAKIPHSVAMKNAVLPVKKIARYETETNLNGGVSKFIKTEILGES